MLLILCLYTVFVLNFNSVETLPGFNAQASFIYIYIEDKMKRGRKYKNSHILLLSEYMAVFWGSLGSGLVFLEDWFAGEAYAEFAENLAVHFGEHHGGMHLTASEFRKFLKGTPTAFVGLGENGESHKHLVGMKPREIGRAHV